MYYVMHASTPSLHRESTDSLIKKHKVLIVASPHQYNNTCVIFIAHLDGITCFNVHMRITSSKCAT